jgi:flagellar hook-length control protein FliK
MDLTIHSISGAHSDAKFVSPDQATPSDTFAAFFNAPPAAAPSQSDVIQTPRNVGTAPNPTESDEADDLEAAPNLGPADATIAASVTSGNGTRDRTNSPVSGLPNSMEQKQSEIPVLHTETAQNGLRRPIDSTPKEQIHSAPAGMNTAQEYAANIAGARVHPIETKGHASPSKSTPNPASAEKISGDSIGEPNKPVLVSPEKTITTEAQALSSTSGKEEHASQVPVGKTAAIDASGVRTTAMNASPMADDSTNSSALPNAHPISDAVASEQGTKPPLTSLERHLGGQPATLTSDLAGQTRIDRPDQGNIRFDFDSIQARSTITNSGQVLIPSHGNSAQSAILGKAPDTMVVKVSTAQSNPDMTLSKVDLMDAFGSEIRTQNSTSTNILAPTSAPRQDMANSVIHQITTAMRADRDKPIEIALNPAELGRVRMVLSASDAGITVNILADRPDTLDLLRRNIDDLGKSFADIGYDDIAFSFGQNEQASDDTAHSQYNTGADHDDGSETLVTMPVTATASRPMTALGSIDLRL